MPEAVKAYEKAIEIDPRNPDHYLNLGAAFLSVQLYARALAASDTAVGIDPRNAAIHNNRGNALVGLGQLADAVA